MTSATALAAELDAAVAAWDRRGWPRPCAAVVSGSGLGVDLGPAIAGPTSFAQLFPFPVHAVEGHPLALEVIEPVPGRPVAYFRGRLHFYQGYEARQVVFATRLARRLGAAVLIQTNAAGGINPTYSPGDLVLIEDHLNLTGSNPLRGELPADWGPRFPDMVNAYDPRLRALAREHAAALGIPLQAGVYAGLTGPCYETPAEVRMLAGLGADITGMSTVQEVIAARQMGLACLGFSLVSNAAAGVTGEPLDHEEVLAAGRAAAADVTRLLGALLADPRLLPAG